MAVYGGGSSIEGLRPCLEISVRTLQRWREDGEVKADGRNQANART